MPVSRIELPGGMALVRVGLLLALLLAAAPLSAQEVNVPIDAAGRLERVDRALALRLGLWTERYPGFEEARLFQAPDGRFVLEITSRREGRLVRDRLAMSRAEAEALRAELTERLAAAAARPAFTQEGRPLLLAGTSLMGLAYYGWAIPYALDVQDTRLAVATYMLTAGASFFVPWALTRDAHVTMAMTDFALWGMTRGAVHGVLLHGAVVGEFDDQSTFATSVAVSAGLAYGAYRWAREAELEPGTTHAIGTLSDLGALGMVGLTAVADADGRGGSAGTLLGAAGGMAAGRWLAARRDYTWGDVEVMRTGALLGVFVPQALVSAADGDDDAHILAGIVGGAAGLALGDRLVRRTNFSPGEAVLIDLGTVAGGFLGLGLAYLLDPDTDGPTLYLSSSALGAALGFGGMYGALAPEARARANRPSAAWRAGLAPRLVVADAYGGRPAISPQLHVQLRF
jgi:hypothetical protein